MLFCMKSEEMQFSNSEQILGYIIGRSLIEIFIFAQICNRTAEQAIFTSPVVSLSGEIRQT
jgi:hypothetical protein